MIDCQLAGKLLLALTNTVILDSESQGTHNPVLLSDGTGTLQISRLRPTVGWPICLSIKPKLGPKTRYLFLSGSCRFVDVGRPLLQEDGYVVYICCLGPSHAGLMIIFYGHRFKIPPTWRARSPYLYPPGTGWSSYTPRPWVPFHCPLQLTGLWWRYSNPLLRGVTVGSVNSLII
jgi:hypothetical protein